MRNWLLALLSAFQLLAGPAAQARPAATYTPAEEALFRSNLLGLSTAARIYGLPDLWTAPDPAELVQMGESFLKSAPLCYQVYAMASDPVTGLNWAVYTPSPLMDCGGAEFPAIITFGGTKSLADVLADLADAATQAASPTFERLYEMIMDPDPRSGDFFAARPAMLISGHSLGGGLAQLLAYRILRERERRGEAAGKVRVVTANSLGGKEIVERALDEELHPQTVAMGEFYNYFITGDMISRIGTQIGETYELTPVREGNAARRFLTQNTIKLHIMETVLKIADPAEGGPGLGVAVKRPIRNFQMITEQAQRRDLPNLQPAYLAARKQGTTRRLAKILEHMALSWERPHAMDVFARPIDPRLPIYFHDLAEQMKAAILERSPNLVDLLDRVQRIFREAYFKRTGRSLHTDLNTRAYYTKL